MSKRNVMGNLVNDIVDNIEIKPNKTRLYLKWGASIAGSLIVLAFAFGQFKSSFFNRMDTLEKKLDKNTTAVEQVRTDMNAGFEAVDKKIDKIYTDGLMIFTDFQEYNNEQLGLIVDYGSGNKDMLKRMLEIGSMKQQQVMETQVEVAKKEEPEASYNPTISVKKLTPEPVVKEYYGEIQMIEIETGDTIFNIGGATRKYYDSINKNKYEVGALTESARYPNRYDFAYRNKRQ